MGIFGAVGRETKGALRSISYDVRHSRRFRRLGTLAVVTVAGGVMATGAVLRTPVPEMMGIESDQDGSGVADGWFGFGSDTRGQDAESAPEPGGESSDEDEPRASEAPSSTAEESERRSRPQNTADGKPGLTPIESTDEATFPEENDTTSPAEPTPEPEPTDEPSDEPTTDEPSPTPTESPTPTGSPSGEPSPSTSSTES